MYKDETNELIVKLIGKKLTNPYLLAQLDKMGGWHDVLEEMEEIGFIKSGDIAQDPDHDTYTKIASLISANISNTMAKEKYQTIAGRNSEALGKHILLNSHEIELLVFLILCHTKTIIKGLFSSYGSLNNTKLIKLISDLSGININCVKNALSEEGSLIKSSIVSIDNFPTSFENKIYFNNGFEGFMVDKVRNVNEIIGFFIKPVIDCKLSLNDYKHISFDNDYIIPYLDKSVKSGISGCNVLLYGKPGTGKTEYAKALAKFIRSDLYEVITSQYNNGEINADGRIRSYLSGQHILKNNRKCIILFDEIEDILGSDVVHSEKSPIKSKVWFNRLLESNPVPTIWTCNSIERLDRAYLRRFDIIIEMPSPPKIKQIEMLTDSLGEYMEDNELFSDVIKHIPICPSENTRITKVVKTLTDKKGADRAIIRLIESSHNAANGCSIDLKNIINKENRCFYQLSWINTQSDIEMIIGAISSKQKGRLCMYGPPGTGKTELAYEIARVSGKQLIHKKASDLISCYVGESERNIAKAFKDGSLENAIVFIDEADTFLSNRNLHERNYETSQVNEMLMQMERFDGILLMATNRICSIDHAALRRFDFKISFDYPTDSQIWDMYSKITTSPDAAYKDRILSLKPLTPGNFAVVKRQSELLGLEMTNEFVYNILKSEADLNRMHVDRKIGFIH